MSPRKKAKPAGNMPLSVLAPDPKNPRQMSDDARAGLSASLEEFGPLDIVFNTGTGELVSGHQRVKVLQLAGAKEVVRENGWAYIVHPKTGERFPVRFVDWPRERQRLANLTANNYAIQGDFTADAEEQLKEVMSSPFFGELKLDALLQGLQVDFQALKGGQIDENLFESFGGSIGKDSKTFAVTLDVPKKHEALFADLPKEEAIDVLVKWLKVRRKS